MSGTGRSVASRNMPSRGSVGLKVGLLMMTEKGKNREQPRNLAVQREDGHGLAGLLDWNCESGQTAAEHRERGSLRIGEPNRVSDGHGEKLHLAVDPFLVGLFEAQLPVRVLDALNLRYEREGVGQANVEV